MITEIGAVKVRGGEVLGEFQTLVNPHTAIPPFIAVLTGITNSMVADAPPIESALPAFLEFAPGCVLVAHNAPFDVGFLQHFAAAAGPPVAAVRGPRHRQAGAPGDHPRRGPQLQALLAGRGSSAPTTTPNHRALSDARATVDVLHGLMERLGGLGVHTLEELQTFSSRVSPAQRRKRHLAERLPHAPGVYLFRDDRAPGALRRHLPGPAHPGAVLLHRLRDPHPDGRDGRPRDRRSTGIECATPLEAEVRELRLIAEHKPRYNRRSRFPEKVHFLKLTREPWPRLSLVRRVLDDDADYLGPFSSRQDRREVPGRAARHLPGAAVLRPARPASRPARPACWPRWAAACRPATAASTPTTYAAVVRQLRDTLLRRPRRGGRGDQPADGDAGRPRAVRGGRGAP